MSSSSGLGSAGLSVRKNRNRQIARPFSYESEFRESLDFGEIWLTGETEFRQVHSSKKARIQTVYQGIDAFHEYLDAKENANLLLKGENEEGETEVAVLDYVHRWKKAYRDKIYAKLKDAEEELERIFNAENVPVTLLSLTAHQTDENGNPRPLGEVLQSLLDGWEDFRKVIHRETEGLKTEYIKVVEPHESGYPHIHVAIFGIADRSLADKIQELWVDKYGVGGEWAHDENSVKVARGRDAEMHSVAGYMMKYLNKSMVRENGQQQKVEGYEAFASLLWVTGKRQFSVSQGLSEAMATTKSASGVTEWRFIGVGHGMEPGRYTGRVADRILDGLKLGIGPPAEAVPGPIQTFLN